MPLFKKKSEVSCVLRDVPRWEDPQFALLAKEWAIGTGLSENWDSKLQTADPPRVLEVLRTVPVGKGGGIGCCGKARVDSAYCLSPHVSTC